MDKIQLTGWNPDRVLNIRSDCLHDMHSNCLGAKLTNLKLKTQSKHSLGFLLLDIVHSRWPSLRLTQISVKNITLNDVSSVNISNI